ncbi:conserved hypothetical protein [Ricinus communis]|uniref:RALFL33 n=1 Tax=Ricinus communis TaxID=3988 RepID=B9TGL2_RICCO|nr:conserved hypothetical protein [Ricinus communis]
MKLGLMLLVLISMTVVVSHVEAKFIQPGVLDPCKAPGSPPPPGCQKNPKSPREESNSYSRGCFRRFRCRD